MRFLLLVATSLLAFVSAREHLRRTVSSNSGATIQNIKFDSPSDLDHFGLQYDWSQHPDGEAEHFKIMAGPGGGEALRIFLGENDLPLSQGSPTYPRSELADYDAELFNGNDYTIQWDSYFDLLDDDYQFCFLQIIGKDEPNIFLRWQQGHYYIWVNDVEHVTFPGSALSDRGGWINWKVKFKLSASSDGYVKVFKAGASSPVGTYNGATVSQNDQPYHPKLGVYTQHVNYVKDTRFFIKNLVVSQTAAAEAPLEEAMIL